MRIDLPARWTYYTAARRNLLWAKKKIPGLNPVFCNMHFLVTPKNAALD